MEQQPKPTGVFLRNVVLKGIGLFLVANLLFALVGDSLHLGKISAYNGLFPGRTRFPFGENAAEAFNFSLYDFEAMFASHEYFGNSSNQDEFTVVLIGDSSVWGTLLKPEETISGHLNQMGLTTCDGVPIHFYNLGYPSLSLTKDLIVLDAALEKKPDLILWFVTLESFPREIQLSTPVVANNPDLLAKVMEKYGITYAEDDPSLVKESFFDKTTIGKRRSLADLVRLQLYGVMWSATGIDQYYPETYTAAQRDLEADATYHQWEPGTEIDDLLAWDVLETGIAAAGEVPVLIVNEPILRSSGENSDIRYDFYYPRWVYDEYHDLLLSRANEQGWNLVDLWNMTPESEFTNSAIHMTGPATGKFAEEVWKTASDLMCTESKP